MSGQFSTEEMCNDCGNRRNQHPLSVCADFKPSGAFESTHVDGPPLPVTNERMDAVYFAAVEASYAETGGNEFDANSEQTRQAHYAGLRAVADFVDGVGGERRDDATPAELVLCARCGMKRLPQECDTALVHGVVRAVCKSCPLERRDEVADEDVRRALELFEAGGISPLGSFPAHVRNVLADFASKGRTPPEVSNR